MTADFKENISLIPGTESRHGSHPIGQRPAPSMKAANLMKKTFVLQLSWKTNV
ncbi:hypothetical protein [Paenibacillus sp. Pae108]|uniref:hypothetical protein n=1 Tax=Paenibacillus TaxID=44249 RepID=UPI002117C887|nr:hypothetical protein [Paenibacillus sp. Pae108]